MQRLMVDLKTKVSTPDSERKSCSAMQKLAELTHSKQNNTHARKYCKC